MYYLHSSDQTHDSIEFRIHYTEFGFLVSKIYVSGFWLPF